MVLPKGLLGPEANAGQNRARRQFRMEIGAMGEAAALLAVWLLPGTFFCLHQGIDHWHGRHIPEAVVFGWDVPHWLLYLVVLLLGPVLLLALLGDMINRS
jgi:hypothetical protein